MPMHETLDLDKLVSIVLDCAREAFKGWLNGVPRDETALMNRLTELLTRTRRGCDVGTLSEVVVKTRVAMLHRKAEDNSDLFGADIAVTVFSERDAFMKTALFQMKKGTGFQAVLERAQMEDMLEDKQTQKRSFVVYVDEERGGIRVNSAQQIIDEFPSSQKYKTFQTTLWLPLSVWLAKWFVCEIGPESELEDPGTIESILSAYEVKTPMHVLPEEPMHTLAWLFFDLIPGDFYPRIDGPRRYLP